jgi:ribosomal protein L37AE/L43A
MENEMADKMLCPDCGVEMNHHANKIDYSQGADEELAARDETFGGTLQEAHCCPECGRTATREAASD